MPTNFPNGVSSFGVPVLPPADQGLKTGNVFFVCNRTNSNGSNGNSGASPDKPLATVDYAIGLCTGGTGNIIYVMEGHAETVTATSIALDVANVRIVGLGHGSARPVFTYGAAAATITVSTNYCRWENCVFVANFADVASAFTLTTAKDFYVTDSLFYDVDSTHNFLCIVTTASTDNAADGLSFHRNQVNSLPTTDGAVISVLGNLDRLSICDNNVDKAATSDAGHLATFSSKVLTGLRILRNTLVMKALASQSTGTLITGSSTTSSGIVGGNWVYQIDTSTGLLATTGQKLGYIENYMSGAADKSGSIFPAVDDPA